jgi:hypothetical protein
VAALEAGSRPPDAATAERLRAHLGALPDGWARADALEGAADRARSAVLAREASLLASVLPRLLKRRDRALRQAGWCAVPLLWPASGTTLTGSLPVTLGALLQGAGPGGPLNAIHDGVPVWIVGAGGSLLSGNGTVHGLDTSGAWHTANMLGGLNVGAAWRALREAAASGSRAAGGTPTRWSLATIAAELGLPVPPVTFTDTEGRLLARWDPRFGALHDASGRTLDTTPHPEDEEAWQQRVPAPFPIRRAGWFEDAEERVVAFFDGWLPDGVAVPLDAPTEPPAHVSPCA